MTQRFKTPGKIERMLIPIFDKAGVKPSFDVGLKHPYVEWIGSDGNLRKMHFSNSPRSPEGARAACRKLKKMLEESA